METFSSFELLSFLISLAILVTWFVLVAQVINIKKLLKQKESYLQCETEAEIASISGNNKEAIDWYIRAMYLYYNDPTHQYYTDEKSKDVLKQSLKAKYYQKIEELGGKFPDYFLPIDHVKNQLAGLEALYKAGKYSQEEYEAEKSTLLNRQ